MAEDAPLVLVTGCSGFVASQICLTLLETGLYRVRGTVRSAAPDAASCSHLRSHVELRRVELVEADLLRDEGWREACEGVTYVLHVASPFPIGKVEPGSLVEPALRGTERVLRAAAAAGTVARVVLTSSVVAVSSGRPAGDRVERIYTEAEWSSVADCDEYSKSKTLAEHRAWELSRELRLDLVAINPSYVLGPLLSTRDPSSVLMCKRLLKGAMPAVPRLWVCSVDVRDVAEAHLKAMTSAEAVGKRFILDSGEGMWMTDIAKLIKQRYPTRPVPTRQAPYCLVALFSLWDKDAAAIRGSIGRKLATYNVTCATELLGRKPRPSAASIAEMCDSMIELGLV
mmetsp:Transcript_129522/g.360856  ORF Transcript_129522/g.360856 Transcript_129522/m.360856 type:complete len:342 (-) Transcript_129522:174-1199(-)